MATPATVVTLGYGSFGSLTTVILVGLGISIPEPAVLVPQTVDFVNVQAQTIDFAATAAERIDFINVQSQRVDF